MAEEFFLDLDAHERSRLASVLEACDGLYNPMTVYQGEQEARRMLYSDLDEHQQAILEELKASGVL
jgi:hypothetical protein